MADATATTDHTFDITVSDDRLQVYLSTKPGSTEVVAEQTILEALRSRDVRLTEEVVHRVKMFVRQWSAGEPCDEKYLIAEGRLPTEGRDEAFNWAEKLQPSASDAEKREAVDYRKRNRIPIADAGEVIGTLTPAAPSQAGVDVFGQPIPPRTQPRQVQLDATVSRSEADPHVLVARVPGRVVYRDHRLAVVEILEIKGDVDFSTGSVQSTVTIQIGGTVRDDFQVQCSKSVYVGGAVEAARVEAEGDITVEGGIVGRSRGRIIAGGRIGAKFCELGHLKAGGDISIERETLDSAIHTQRRILAPNGSIIGGELFARQGIEVGVLGNDAGVRTRLTLGVDPDVLAQTSEISSEIARRRAAVANVRETLQPLLANQRRLSAAQKEQATELLYRADEMEAEIEQIERSRCALLQSAQPEKPPYVIVRRMIHAGVTIRMGQQRTRITSPLRGPLRIELRPVGKSLDFVAKDEATGNCSVLPAEPVVEHLPSMQREKVEG